MPGPVMRTTAPATLLPFTRTRTRIVDSSPARTDSRLGSVTHWDGRRACGELAAGSTVAGGLVTVADRTSPPVGTGVGFGVGVGVGVGVGAAGGGPVTTTWRVTGPAVTGCWSTVLVPVAVAVLT